MGQQGQAVLFRYGHPVGDRHQQRGGQQMRRFHQLQGGAVQARLPVAQRPQRAFQRHAQVIRRVGQRPQPVHPRIRRHHDPRDVAVIGRRLQRFRPPRRQRQFRLPQRPQGGQTVSLQRLHRHDKEGPSVPRQDDGHTHPQIPTGAGQAFDGGRGKGGTKRHVKPLPPYLGPSAGN